METFLRTKNILQNFHIFAKKTGVFAFFVQIQYLNVFSKDIKHLYADNIQFAGGLNFGTKHTMSTLINLLFHVVEQIWLISTKLFKLLTLKKLEDLIRVIN